MPDGGMDDTVSSARRAGVVTSPMGESQNYRHPLRWRLCGIIDPADHDLGRDSGWVAGGGGGSCPRDVTLHNPVRNSGARGGDVVAVVLHCRVGESSDRTRVVVLPL